MSRHEILRTICIATGIYYLIAFIMGLSTFGIVYSMEENEQINKSLQIYAVLFNQSISLILGLFFLLKNKLIVELITEKFFIENGDNQNKGTISKLSFWIKIIGIYYFVSSISSVLSKLPSILSFDYEYLSNSFWWNQTGSKIILLILSIFLIFKSTYFERLIRKYTN